MGLKAVVFDFDGTLVDTEYACFLSWKEVFDAHGCPVPLDEWKNVVGTAAGVFDPWAYLQERIGRKIDVSRLGAARRARELELVSRLKLRPGVESLLDEVARAGLKLGLATSSHRDWFEPILKSLGVRDRFESVACADEVERLKPDPALYRLALERLGVRAEDAIAIEDSPNGMLGAKRAGLVCVVVPNDVTRMYEFPGADARLETLEGVRLADLEEIWRRRSLERRGDLTGGRDLKGVDEI